MNKLLEIKGINPIDFYNINYLQETFDYMTTLKNVNYVARDAIAYATNKSEQSIRMIIVEEGYFVAHYSNGLNMEVHKKYSPFMMIQQFMFKGNYQHTLNYVKLQLMNLPNDYVRVGFKYFKNIDKSDRYDIKRTELKYWEKSALLDDFGKDIINDIPRYDDFTIEPNNVSYQRIIGNNYNLYAPFEHKPCLPEEYLGDRGWLWTRQLLHHIFGEQLNLGLQYMQILYFLPKQALPILVMTSGERQTGKTTFVDWLNILFGANMVVINPQDISNNHNSSYADKNIIAIEESRFESVQATEKLKNLATQKEILVNPKFVPQYSIPFYGKLIITSNDESKFSRVDKDEIRYWVRKVPSLKGKANHQILDDLRAEIPQFLYYLSTLPDVDKTKSRMIFKAADLNTEALETVKEESLPSLHKNIMLYLEEFAANNENVEEILFVATDIKEMWFKNNHQIEASYINKILRDSMKLPRGKMQRFIPLETNEAQYKKKKSGKPFIFKNENYKDDTNRQPSEEKNTNY
jgi:hypothetical protein